MAGAGRERSVLISMRLDREAGPDPTLGTLFFLRLRNCCPPPPLRLPGPFPPCPLPTHPPASLLVPLTPTLVTPRGCLSQESTNWGPCWLCHLWVVWPSVVLPSLNLSFHFSEMGTVVFLTGKGGGFNEVSPTNGLVWCQNVIGPRQRQLC